MNVITHKKKAKDVKVDSSLPHLTKEELDRGWYYSNLKTKRPGTPDNWEYQLEGTRSARWSNPRRK
jgi:hypothetical protein